MRCTPFALALAVVASAPAGCTDEEMGSLSTPVIGDTPTTPTLVGRAVLPATSFAAGPTSGTRLGTAPINGVAVPFVDKQPIQGFSGLLDNHDGTFLGLADNGFGSLESSSDFRLRLYRLRPQLETAVGGPGTVDVLGFIELRDPHHKIPFTIANERTAHRKLTGADFDIESVQRAPDGTLWIGDEFGPFLLHVDATGKLLDPPFPLPDIRSPQNPFNEEASAVRIMNAVSLGAKQRPVISPWHVMLADNDPATFVPSREAPPPESGLAAASSEIFDVTSLHAAGYPVVPYTINDPARMRALLDLKVDGIISDRPDLLFQAIADYGYLDADGLIDRTKIDAQGHRGGRDLRPENTIPAFEVALDHLMTTLELDVGLSKDLVPLLDHDPLVQSEKCRRADGTPYDVADEVLIRSLLAWQIRQRYVCDKLFRGPQQINDPAASPVAVAYRAAHPSLPHIYAMPSLHEVFDFVDFYVDYYRDGAGASHPDATRRWKNAARVRFNIETKINPRSEYADRTYPPVLFALIVGGTILLDDLPARADIQSFDFRSLLLVQLWFPAIRTVYLFGDFPTFDDDGTNLEPEGANTPWMAGLRWPYRVTQRSHPFRAKRSGGFEGMAISPDGTRLFPMLELALAGDDPKRLRIFEFDLATKQYVGERASYFLDSRGTNIGDFILIDDERGLVIERDPSQGDLAGFKRVYQITFDGDGPVTKQLAVDLMAIADPAGISLPAEPGDVGLGETFAMPFNTIEDIVLLDERRILVVDDNNFPFSVGRHAGSGRPDDTELVVIDLGSEL